MRRQYLETKETPDFYKFFQRKLIRAGVAFNSAQRSKYKSVWFLVFIRFPAASISDMSPTPTHLYYNKNSG